MTDDRTVDEPLPWLVPVEDEDEPQAISAQRMLRALALVVLGAAIIAGTFFWLGHRQNLSGGPPQLIKAPQAPYKIKPPNPGGLDISQESETAFETSAGEDKDSRLDLNKVPETPVAKPAKPQPVTHVDAKNSDDRSAPKAEDKAQSEAKPVGGSGSVVQLGAFANQAQAERAWTALSARFPAVAALNKMIVPFTGGIRLRAAAPSQAEAKQVCQTLKAAGENCFVAQ